VVLGNLGYSAPINAGFIIHSKGGLVKILVVEDDSLLRAVIKKILKTKGFQIIEAGDGIDGYKIIQEVGSEISLLLTDINMPRMDGLSLAQLTAALCPDMPILLMTGNPSWLPHPMGTYAVLRKPFLSQALVLALREAIAAGDRFRSKRSESTAHDAGPSPLESVTHKRPHARQQDQRHHSSRHFEKVPARTKARADISV
jgi:DNA-binding NtrC family response regulator